jgi:replicative DNA helicase
LNLASALIKQVLVEQDFETWAGLRQRYLPAEYHTLFKVIDSHCEHFHMLPSIEDLKYELRDAKTRDKLYAIESVEVDADPYQLLQYLKNEYTQKEIFTDLEDFVDNSVAFENAEEAVEHLHQIVIDIGDKVELEMPQESMQRIALFEDDLELDRYLSLGLNTDYDNEIQFSPRDLVLIGGKRGAGKSIVCTNIADGVYNNGKSVIHFTIEMDSRDILQRACSVAIGIPYSRLRTKNLSVTEWEKVAHWWASRFLRGQEKLKEYREHRDFDQFHYNLTNQCDLLPTQQLDVVYDPSLTLAKIRAELDKKVKSKLDVGVVIVDYINQVKRSALPNKGGQYDWTEQIEVAKALKTMAQDYNTTVVSPYQIDASGEARFAKGILDSADAAFTIEPYEQEDECISLNCVKMRSGPMRSFTSTMDWSTLKIGPDSAETPKEKEENTHGTGEEVNDVF